MRLRLLLLPLWPLVFCTGCGPSDQTIAASALIALTLGNLVNTPLTMPLILGWRGLRPHLRTRWGLYLATCLLHLTVGIYFALSPEGRARADLELAFMGLWVVVPLYLGLTLLLLRLFWVRGWSAAHGLAPLLASLPILIPAALILTGSLKDVGPYLAIWFWGGLLAPILFIGTLIELAVRRRRLRQAAAG